MKVRRNDFIVKKEKKKYSVKQILLISLGIIWMIASLGACFVVYKTNPIYSIIIFGQYFLIFGLNYSKINQVSQMLKLNQIFLYFSNNLL